MLIESYLTCIIASIQSIKFGIIFDVFGVIPDTCCITSSASVIEQRGNTCSRSLGNTISSVRVRQPSQAFTLPEVSSCETTTWKNIEQFRSSSSVQMVQRGEVDVE